MIKIVNLSKTYPNGITALKNINLEVKKGEILGIIGKSGAGKTTLLRILRGVEPFDSGKVKIDDVEVSHDSNVHERTKLKRITAIHLQRTFGLWSETAIENVIRKLYAAKFGDETTVNMDEVYDEFKDEALELLDAVGLKHKAEHFAPVLSGGEKQRLIIARQLAKKPKVLLLDEPATMACPKTKQEVLDAIKRVNEKLGITVVLVSHLPEVHYYLADRVVWLENGKIKDEGDPETIIKKFMQGMEPAIHITPKIGKKIIEVKDIKKRYFLVRGGLTLQMKDINLDIKKGEIVSIIGPSGAGKTVLLRIIGGLEFPDGGHVKFRLNDEWVDMHKLGIKRMGIRRKMGFMHQEFALIHHATIRDQIAARLGVKGEHVVAEAKERAEKLGISDKVLDMIYQLTDMPEDEAKYLLEKIGLSPDILEKLFPKFPYKEVLKYAKPVFKALKLPLDILDMKSYELSGGQQVRAALALVLASKPDVVILDEPFGDLDPITLRSVSNSLKRINKKFNTTILMVSHHMDFVKELSTRAIMMEDGRIVMDDDPEVVCDELIKRSHAKYLEKVKALEV